MGIKQMLTFWDEDKILVRDEELVVLQSTDGPNRFVYHIHLVEADIEMDLEYNTKRDEFIRPVSARKFEEGLFKLLRTLAGENKNDEPPPQRWRRRANKNTR